jgi:predicted SprT family Zn-dependent metalloprotease
MKRNYIELIRKVAKQLKKDFPEYENVINLYSNYDINTRAKRRFGQCNYRLKQIQLCAYSCDKVTLEEVIDTIKHEFAHAITYEVYHERGHGRIWQKVAKKIGSNGKRCSKKIEEKEYTPYILVFDNDGDFYFVNNILRLTKNYKNAYFRNDGILENFYMKKYRKETENKLKVISTQEHNLKNLKNFSDYVGSK